MREGERTWSRWAVGWLGACALAIAVVYVHGNEFRDIEGYEGPKELVLMLAAMGCGLFCLRATRRLTLDGPELAFLLFALLACVSSVAVTSPVLAWRSVCLSASAFVLFVSARAVARAGEEAHALTAAAGAVVLTALLVLCEGWGFFPRLSLLHRAPGGGHGNRNFAAHLIALGLPVLAALSFRASGLARRVAWSLALGAATAALVLTRCRAAWLGVLVSGAFSLGAGHLVFGLKLGRRHAVAAAAVAAGVLVAVLTAPHLWRTADVYVKTLSSIGDYETGSGHARLVQYRSTLAMIRQHPVLGVGPGQWPIAYAALMDPNDASFHPTILWQTPIRPTSDWLGFAAERGVPAALSLCFGFVLIARALFRRRATPQEQERARLGGAVLAALAVMSSLDSVLQLAAPTLFVFVVLGALVPPRAVRAEDEPPLLSLPISLQRPALATLTLLGVAAVGFLAREWRVTYRLAHSYRPEEFVAVAELASGDYRAQAFVADLRRRAGDCASARAYALRALALNPQMRLAQTALKSCPAAEH